MENFRKSCICEFSKKNQKWDHLKYSKFRKELKNKNKLKRNGFENLEKFRSGSKKYKIWKEFRIWNYFFLNNLYLKFDNKSKWKILKCERPEKIKFVYLVKIQITVKYALLYEFWRKIKFREILDFKLWKNFYKYGKF